MYLQMVCMDYLKNFYNDHEFKTNKYSHLLQKVLPICNQMILKYSSAVSDANYQVVNEILELYRFIVEKYAGFNQLGPNGEVCQSMTVICELAMFLNTFWQKYSSVELHDQKQERERSLILSSIMRIMSHVLSKIPIKDLPKETVQQIVEIAFVQANQGVLLSKDDYLLLDFAKMYISCLARIMSKIVDETGLALPKENLEPFKKSLQYLLDIAKDESDDPSLFFVIQDITLLIGDINGISIATFIDSTENYSYVADYLKVLLMMMAE